MKGFRSNRTYLIWNLSMFDTSPDVSIWLEMSINWHTKSQGPKKKCTHFSRGRNPSCPAGTAGNQGSFTSMALWSVQSFLSSTVCSKIFSNFHEIEFCHFILTFHMGYSLTSTYGLGNLDRPKPFFINNFAVLPS